jgi:hypothetical protein
MIIIRDSLRDRDHEKIYRSFIHANRCGGQPTFVATTHDGEIELRVLHGNNKYRLFIHGGDLVIEAHEENKAKMDDRTLQQLKQLASRGAQFENIR